MTEDRPGASANPPGAGTADPPPLTAFAWRNGLVRPTHGRLLAGVCGALARATNTDPILWRVILAVLTIFGGIGVLAYLLGWLLLPADGDTASPLEAVLGRGHSRTSTVLTIIAGVIVVLSLAAFVSEPLRPGLLGVALLGGAVLLLLRDGRGRNRPAPVAPATMWSAPAGTTTGPQPPTPPGAPPVTGAGPGAPFGPQPPFAPRGPFVPPVPPTPPYGPVTPPPVPPPPVPRPPRSPLGRLTLSLVLVVVGVLAVVDLLGASVPAGAYFAAALTVVGLGLLTGTWVGRARGLIGLGIVLSVALASTAAAFHYNRDWRGGTNLYQPSSLTQVESHYGQDVGDVTLDLSRVDFSTATEPVNVDLRLDVGSAKVILPPNVDVVINAKVDVGNADVLGQTWSGLGLDQRTVTDNGADGAGGGKLNLTASIDLGNLEVHR
jgi:phage shock protein PspC (stress-responsive transcriptional regulator)